MNRILQPRTWAFGALTIILASCLICCSGSAEQTTDSEVQDAPQPFSDGPVIDESTLIPDTLNIDPDSLGIPPRRFYDTSKAIRHMHSSENWTEYREGILVRMVEDNLPYADRLLNSAYEYFIVVDKQSMNVALFDRYGRLVKQYPMDCARNYGTKHRRNDSRTPEGFFFAQGVYDSSAWPTPEANGASASERGAYGPRFIRISASITSTFGIHGTDTPGSLGKRVGSGCIIVSNESILDLARYVQPGMPIIVNPSDRDVAVNRNEGYDIVPIYTGLKASVSSRDLSGEVSNRYPAKPAVNDSIKSAEPAVLPDSLYIEDVDEADSLLTRPEIVTFPDSVHQ